MMTVRLMVLLLLLLLLLLMMRIIHIMPCVLRMHLMMMAVVVMVMIGSTSGVIRIRSQRGSLACSRAGSPRYVIVIFVRCRCRHHATTLVVLLMIVLATVRCVRVHSIGIGIILLAPAFRAILAFTLRPTLLELRELCLDLLLLLLLLHVLARASLHLVVHGDVRSIIGNVEDRVLFRFV
uniref:Putative secreted peptide n=1 Tax=Anopheles braziliensis TaxID=58242 RepID=A0A2M3ZMA0_9DIPT